MASEGSDQKHSTDDMRRLLLAFYKLGRSDARRAVIEFAEKFTGCAAEIPSPARREDP